eukprot:5610901-Pyramimonas_sp.AAC.1
MMRLFATSSGIMQVVIFRTGTSSGSGMQDEICWSGSLATSGSVCLRVEAAVEQPVVLQDGAPHGSPPLAERL